MMKKTAFLILLITGIAFSACKKMPPSSFWRDYHTDLIVENKSGHSHKGGYSSMHWQSKKKGVFKKKELLAYAKKNGWKLTKVYKADSATVSTWLYHGHPVFPLSYNGFTPRNLNEPDYMHFKRAINGPVKIFAFKTGYLSIERDDHDSTERNGFLVLSEDGSKMSVYLLWGE